MSKAALKREFQGLTKEQLVEQILDMYDKNKVVKELYDFYLNPKNENKLIEKYKKAIYREFNLKNPMEAGLKFSVAKRAIADFKSLQPSPVSLADLMLYLPECACEFTAEYGDITQPFYDAACNNFAAALKFIDKHGLLDDFKLRARKCVEWSSPCGWGFADEIADIYANFYKDNQFPMRESDLIRRINELESQNRALSDENARLRTALGLPLKDNIIIECALNHLVPEESANQADTIELDRPDSNVSAIETITTSDVKEINEIPTTLPLVNKHSSPEEKIELFMSLFRGRADVYAKRCYSKEARKQLLYSGL